MAIHWGAKLRNGFQGVEAGIDVSWSDVSNGSSNATATVKYYIGVRARSNDDPTLHMSGAISGSVQFHNSNGQNGNPDYDVYLITTRTYTYTYGASEYGSSPGSRTFSASITGTYNGLHPSVSYPTQIPARPYADPADPTSLVMSLNSQGEVRQSWTRHSTAAAPYRSQHVRLSWWDGTTYNDYSSPRSITGGASSYVWSSAGTFNRCFRAVVQAFNPAGSSAVVYPSQDIWVYGQPAAPSGVKARVSADGSSIILAWSNNSYTQGATTNEVERSVNGGAYTVVKTGLSATATGWTDASPGAGSNQYRLRVKHTKEAYDTSDVYSSYASSNTVSTIVAPLAPTLLDPNGSYVDLTKDFSLGWTPHDGGDGADETHFTIDYQSRPIGSATWSGWTNLVTDGTNGFGWSLYTVTGGTLSNANEYQWRVKDEGVVSAGYGPYSDVASFTGSASPVIALTSPSTTVTSGHVTAEWSYSQSGSVAQGHYLIALTDTANQAVLESYDLYSAATSQAFTTPLENGGTYEVGLVVWSAQGVISDKATVDFTVAFPVPAAITTVAEYQPDTGTMLLSMTPDAPGTGESVAESAKVERSVDGGISWVTLTETIDMPADFIDPLPLTTGVTQYRITTIHADPPTYRANDIVLADGGSGDTNRWLFINWGDDWQEMVQVYVNLSLDVASDRNRSVQALAGQAKPRQLIGENTSYVVSVKGDLIYDSPFTDGLQAACSLAAWEDAAQVAGVVCYRDPEGRRRFGMLSGVGTSASTKGMGSVSFTFTEDDSAEVYGEPVGGVA